MFCFTKKCLIISSIIMFFCSFVLYHINKEEYLYNMYKQESIEEFYFKKLIILNKSLSAEKRTKNSKLTIEIENMKSKDDNITCYNVIEGDALPSIDDASIIPPDNSIFFHETSCRECFNSRQACAIESAAKAHPKRNIYVLFSGPISLNILNLTRNSLSELKTYPNIVFARVLVENYAKGTALEDLFVNQVINTSKWKIRHASDLLRVITMYKYGGMFLDTDTIVLKSMDDLGKNWVGKQYDDELSNAAVHVAKDELGQGIMKMVLDEISRTYEPHKFIHNGCGALERVFLNFCNVTDVEQFSKTTCRGFQFHDWELLFPVPWYEYGELFKPRLQNDTFDAYTIHFWNYVSARTEVQRTSPLDQLAKLHCPVIYKLYENGDSFGY